MEGSASNSSTRDTETLPAHGVGELGDDDTEERTSFSEYSNISLDGSRIMSSGSQIPDDIRAELEGGSTKYTGTQQGATQSGTQTATQPGMLPTASQIRQLVGGRTGMLVQVGPGEMSTPVKNIVPPTPRNAVVHPTMTVSRQQEEDERDADLDAISSEVDEAGNSTIRPPPRKTAGKNLREISETPQSQHPRRRRIGHFLTPTRQGSEDLSQVSLDRLPRTPWSAPENGNGHTLEMPQLPPPEPILSSGGPNIAIESSDPAVPDMVTIFAKDVSTNRVKAFNVAREMYEQAKIEESKTVEGRFPWQPEVVSVAFHSSWLAHIEVGDSVMLDIDGRRGKAYTVLDTFKGAASTLGYSMRGSGHTMLKVSRTVSSTSSPKSKRRRKSSNEDEPSIPENVSLEQIYLNQQMFVTWLKTHDVSSINKLRYENNLLVYAHGHRKARPHDVYESDDDDDAAAKIEQSSREPAAVESEAVTRAMANVTCKGKPFLNCTFSVSMSHDPRAYEVMAYICAGGGEILENGLTDRIVLDSSQQIQSWDFSDNEKFGGVIAASQLRTAKYLEMAACGWPVLSHEFIYDAAERGDINNWQQYVMAAGHDHNDVCWSLDVSLFAERWLAGASLSSQFARRRLLLGGIRPQLHTLLKSDDPNKHAVVFLVALMSHNAELISSLSAVPEGSVVIDVADTSKIVHATDRRVLQALQRDASLEKTLVVGKDWLINCIISGKLI